MRLSIYSLRKILFQGEAESVNLKTVSGEITVLDHHRPLVSTLTEGVMKIVDKERKERYFSVSAGFLEIQANNNVRCIVDEEHTETQKHSLPL